MGRTIRWFRQKFSRLGPGFITGAADDDPSGVATYSMAGAQYGYRLNWLSLFLIPMMYTIQEMSGRIGMCSNMGLTGVLRKYRPRRLLIFSVILLITANVINIGADLGIMAASAVMLMGYPFFFWLAGITTVTILLEIAVPYRTYAKFLRLAGFVLLVYIATAILVRQDWPAVIRATVWPSVEISGTYLLTMVGFIGTSISPYLFFWQASEEVEEEISTGTTPDFSKRGAAVTESDITHMRKDTAAGMVFSNIIAAAIVLTTAATLFRTGITDIETPQQAALALRPIAGNFAYILFAVGIIGIGFQSIPVLAGGVAYAFSEAFGFAEGLGKPFTKAKIFYLALAAATIIGGILNIIGVNPIRALLYAAVVNGIVSAPLIAVIIGLADDKRIVGNHRTPFSGKIIGWLTFLFVSASSLILLYAVFFLH